MPSNNNSALKISQALHIIRIKYWNVGRSGNPSLIPVLWNILLHKQANILSPSVSISAIFDNTFVVSCGVVSIPRLHQYQMSDATLVLWKVLLCWISYLLKGNIQNETDISLVVIIVLTEVFDGTIPSKSMFPFLWNPYLWTDGASPLILFLVKNFEEKEI